MKMNAFEIEQIEKRMKASTRLPLPFQAWADIEQRARQERARVVGKALAGFFAAAFATLAGLARRIRSTAADCTDARLRHDH
jgi:hypothetical protein